MGAAVVSRGGDLRAVGGGAGTGLPRRPEVLSRGTPGNCIACIAPAVVTGVPAVGGRRVAAPRAVSSVRAAERRSCFGGEIELSETKPLALRGWGRTRSGGFSGALVTVEDGIGRLLVNEARALGLPSPPRNLAGRGPGTGSVEPGWPRPPLAVPADSLPSALCAQYLHVFLNEVTALVPVLSEAKHSFALYTPERTRQRWPVRLAAATEQDMNDWVSGRRPSRPGGEGQPSLGPLPAACPVLTSLLPAPAGPAQPLLL